MIFKNKIGSNGWLRWGIALLVSSFLITLATLPPFVHPGIRVILMQVFSATCHQIPERSPHIDGVVLAVCHRCYGFYGGLFGAAFSFMLLYRWDRYFMRVATLLIPISIFIPGVDWFIDWIGIWENTPESRVTTGGLFGLVAGYFFVRAFMKERRSNPILR